TASILLPLMMMTPPSIGGPDTGRMRPPLMASRSWAASGPAAARTSVSTEKNRTRFMGLALPGADQTVGHGPADGGSQIERVAGEGDEIGIAADGDGAD